MVPLRIFRIAMTGDFLDESGGVAYGDIGLARLEGCPYVRWHFLTDLAPKPGDSTYWSRLYSLEVTPEHIQDVDGLVVLRPWVKRSTFANGAEDLVVIGRSGAGYDKIDLAACTEHGVAVFNAPMALNHSTASSALLFMLALAKRLPDQERVVQDGRWDRQAAVMGTRFRAGRSASSAWVIAAGNLCGWSHPLTCASSPSRRMPTRKWPRRWASVSHRWRRSCA